MSVEPATYKAQLKDAELRKAVAEAEEAEHSAVIKRIVRQDHELADSIEKAGDHFNSVFKLYGEVRDESIVAVENGLLPWSRRHPGEPLTLRLYSPGGDLRWGYVLFDTLRTLRDSGHHLTIVVRGMAASMGAVLLQAADKRVVGREAMIMIHEVASLAWGKSSEIKDQAQLMDRLTRRTAEILSERSNKTPDEILEMMDRKDVWLSAQEAIDIGLADEIG